MGQFNHQGVSEGRLIPSVLTGNPVAKGVQGWVSGSKASSGVAPNHTAGEVYRRKPQFVMCSPKFLDNKIKNNVFMDSGKKIDRERAMIQYARIKRLLTAFDVQVLEVPPIKGCQDQAYTANLFIAINPFIVLAKMSAPGRACEEAPGRRFFEGRGYTVIQPPYAFEGEADMKKWKDGVYFGGYGKFSDIKAFDWISKKTGCEVIPLEEVSDKSFHLDCSLFVIDEENFLVNREGISPKSFKELEKRANIIVTPPDHLGTGGTNLIRIPGNKKILISGMLFPEDPKYQKSIEWMHEFADKFGFSMVFVDIDTYDLSGADVSCCVGHLDF